MLKRKSGKRSARRTNKLRKQFADYFVGRRNLPAECFTRASSPLRTLSENKRQVECIAATEDPALVFDWMTGKVVLEVLLVSGCEFEDSTPLIRDHNQSEVNGIAGAFLNPKVVQDRLEGLIEIGKDLDEDTEATWRRIKAGYLRRVSIGYDYGKQDYITIPAGETATVAGRKFTAPTDRDLRIVKRWRLRELSLVVIPADRRAQLRAQARAKQHARRGTTPGRASKSAKRLQSLPRSTGTSMKKFIAYLHKCGMAQSITDTSQAIAWARSGNLTSTQLTKLGALCKLGKVKFDISTAEARRTAPRTTSKRSASRTVTKQTGTRTRPERTATSAKRGSRVSTETKRTESRGDLDVQTISRNAAREALRNERARVSQIRSLGEEHGIAAEVIQRSIDKEHSINQARAAFLKAMRNSRSHGAPAIHSRGGLSGTSGVRVLQAALMNRAGITPDSDALSRENTASLVRRRDLNIAWACGAGERGERRDQLESAYDQVFQQGLQDASMMDIAQALVEMETGARAYNQDDILQRAFSSGNFSAIFGSVVHLSLWQGYASTPSKWDMFCDVEDVPDLKDNSEAMVGEVGRLKKMSKSAPGEATLLNISDPTLAKLAADRYAGKLAVSELNFINDAFGALSLLPFKLGQSTKAIVDDLVWAQMLSTANLTDGRARFNTTDGNLIAAGGLATPAGIGTMFKMLGAVTVGGRRIAVGKPIVVTGMNLGPTFKSLQTVKQLVTADNPMAGEFDLCVDTAVDIGVNDPSTDPETTIAGRPNSYFGFAAGASSVRVAFRAGTNRGPITRTKVMDGGNWGLIWDVYVDCGAAFLRRIGAVEIRT